MTGEPLAAHEAAGNASKGAAGNAKEQPDVRDEKIIAGSAEGTALENIAEGVNAVSDAIDAGSAVREGADNAAHVSGANRTDAAAGTVGGSLDGGPNADVSSDNMAGVSGKEAGAARAGEEYSREDLKDLKDTVQSPVGGTDETAPAQAPKKPTVSPKIVGKLNSLESVIPGGRGIRRDGQNMRQSSRYPDGYHSGQGTFRPGQGVRGGQGMRGSAGGFSGGQGAYRDGASSFRRPGGIRRDDAGFSGIAPGARSGAQRGDRRTGRAGLPAGDGMGPEQKAGRKQQGRDNYKKRGRDYGNTERDELGPRNRKNLKSVPIKSRSQEKQPEKEEEKIKVITIPETLTVRELADHMKLQPSVIVKKLFLQGKTLTVNQEIDYETAEEIALEFEVLCEKEQTVDVIEELLREEEEDASAMVKRPPVVCVMGHVDHGKTSLLDAIRNTSVTKGEAGGITQHIGAYVAKINGESITFLDTPGHEAFTAMRMRGANSTDIAILVVAADDGVMPQTVEAINHAKAAGVEIIVAINKIDKPNANPDKVKQELTEYELVSEDWGGSTVMVPVSAKTGEGLTNLMEMILLTADVLELKANPNRRARGIVIEAKLDKGKGPVATVLVQKGTLHVGDIVAVGPTFGKVRAMMDDKGERLDEAGPSTPVEILGLASVPNAGEIFVGCANEKDARSFAETFISQNKAKLIDETKSRMSLDDLFTQIQNGNLKELNIIVKADVQGSVEALRQSLTKLSNDEVVVKVIHGGVGAINESDVTLAAASGAVIIGFNVRPDAAAKDTADNENVDIRLYDVIYNAIDDVEAAMKGMLDPVYEEKILGHAEIRQIFKASGVGAIAGSYVLDGVIERGCRARITRDGEVIYDGDLSSLKRFKDDVKEVKTGFECGIVFDNFNDITENDEIEAYRMVEVPR